jgi:AraC-like DNA-binding protein
VQTESDLIATTTREIVPQPCGGESMAGTRLVLGLVALPALIRKLGADPAPIFASAGLDRGVFDDPLNRVPHEAVVRVLNEAAARAPCPHFGLLAGGLWRLSAMGIVGEVIRHSPTVGRALQDLVTFQHLNADGALAFLIERDGVVELGYAFYTPFTESTVHVYDAALALATNIMRELCGERWKPAAVFCSHSAPADVTPFKRFFRAQLHFDSLYCAICFPQSWMAQPVRDADPTRYRLARMQAEAAGKVTLVDSVHRALRALLLHGKASGADVAQALAMHRRTLNRRLKEQGTTFQQVLDRVRFAVAKELLESSEAGMPQIAAALGYADAVSFTRAFRRCTGTTPGAWRRSAP